MIRADSKLPAAPAVALQAARGRAAVRGPREAHSSTGKRYTGHVTIDRLFIVKEGNFGASHGAVVTMANAAHVSRILSLYKRILLLHRFLPIELRALGDQYVKDEFRPAAPAAVPRQNLP
ncbi:hypothetical protein Z043_105830 [Scleropages formosus]|uniref:Succinate dehydrogenase assembly factor 3 n=1 Tax=Scleropages formosus TaxID=113540 RepID=A0A0P7V1X3_SCLFO|nr:hypothetical protein Z043_105830 [Scleropages formosus]